MLPNRTNDVVRSILAAGVAAIVATVGTFTTLNVTTGILSTIKVGSSGSTMGGSYRATLSVNPQSIAAGGSTTTVVTVTGAVAGDHCMVNATTGDLLSTTSTAVLACRAGTDNATVFYYNATSTSAFDAGVSTLSVKVDSY